VRAKQLQQARHWFYLSCLNGLCLPQLLGCVGGARFNIAAGGRIDDGI
jgi:hypothetical protein